MGSEQVSSLPYFEKQLKDIFNDFCSLYLTYGMSWDEYWNGDCEIVKIYKKKHEIEIEQTNYSAWLNGAYIYNALLCASPCLNGFSNGKPLDYVKKPFPITAQAQEQAKQEEYDKARNKMLAFAMQFNENKGQQ